MTDKLCISERRTRILEFLAWKKQSTYYELSFKFDVSRNTIHRDIVYLSAVAPVYTKQGNNGGVYLQSEYRSYKNYLTDEEECCLYELMGSASADVQKILNGIIVKFTKNVTEIK